MAIETAPMGGANRRPAARYQALSSGRPQDPTLQEQAAAIAKKESYGKRVRNSNTVFRWFIYFWC